MMRKFLEDDEKVPEDDGNILWRFPRVKFYGKNK